MSTYKQRLRELYDDLSESYEYKLEPVSVSPSGATYHDYIMSEFDKAIEESKNDMVNNPPHYNQGGIETIDYMKAYASKEEYQGHLRLTAIKYLSRSGKKYNRAEDLKKGAWYLNKLIEDVKERG